MSDCLFCQIAAKAIPARIVHEDDSVVAFDDIHPQAPVHVLVIPRRHMVSVKSLREADEAVLMKMMLVANAIAAQRGIADSGYRLVTNTGAHAGQSVFHLHWHLLGGRSMRWPPG
jgi:histidine triad (HIT) family protein